MNKILNLLLLATTDNNSFFYKEYFPLDIFKIIYGEIKIFEKQLDVVKKNCWAIQFIKNPSELVQLEAIRQNSHVIRYINKNKLEKV